jgi:hypothetical protein
VSHAVKYIIFTDIKVKVDESGWPVHEDGISIKAGQKVQMVKHGMQIL